MSRIVVFVLSVAAAAIAQEISVAALKGDGSFITYTRFGSRRPQLGEVGCFLIVLFSA